MFAGISGVILVLVVAFLFRSSLKKANEVLPEVVNTTLGTVAKASVQLDRVITVNCLESDAELNARASEVVRTIEAQGGLVDINALYQQYHK